MEEREGEKKKEAWKQFVLSSPVYNQHEVCVFRPSMGSNLLEGRSRAEVSTKIPTTASRCMLFTCMRPTEIRMSVPGCSYSIGSEHEEQDEQAERKELDVGEQLPSDLVVMWVAGDVIAIEATALGHHGTIKSEGCLVEPQALESDWDCVGEVRREAGGEEGTRNRRGDAETDEEDEQEVVITLQSLVSGRVEVEQQILWAECSSTYQTQCPLRQM